VSAAVREFAGNDAAEYRRLMQPLWRSDSEGALAAWRRAKGQRPARVKSGSGAVEKNVEVSVNRRFKRQGRSWHPERAGRLLQLKLLMSHERAWPA
jgi:hypothetical protein